MRKFLAVTVLGAGLAAAADLSGIWMGQMEVRNGQKIDIAFHLKQEGTRLRGKLYGDYESSPIVHGIVTGNLVTFVVETQEQAGNQINQSRIRFTGNLDGDELELIRERESSHNAGNKGGAASRESKQRFRAKRLLVSESKP